MAKTKQLAKPEKKTPERPRIKTPAAPASRQDGSREYAYMLYLQRVAQGDIAQRCGVSVQTISGWKKKDNWEAKRAAKTISMDTLIVKALERINQLLDADDFNADAFAKSVAQLKALKQRNTVDDEIMCFLDFQNWLFARRTAESIDEQFIKQLTRLQDSFIQNRIGNAEG